MKRAGEATNDNRFDAFPRYPADNEGKRQRSLKSPEPRAIHQPFDDPSSQIRLLRKIQCTRNTELALEISTFTLADAPAFYAISYTWGCSKNHRIVTVCGKAHDVNQNCFYALWQACLHYPDIFISIDSICISQDDHNEKSAQVRIMPEIYRGAERVLACVGPHADCSTILINEMLKVEYLGLALPTVNPARWDPESWLKSFFTNEQGYLQLLYAFRTFQNRSYWRRLWIIQEIALAARVDILCGGDYLSFKSLEILYELDYAAGPRKVLPGDTSSKTQDLPPPCTQFDSLMHYFKSRKGGNGMEISLPHLLGMFKEPECANLHDRVYGLLGLASPAALRDRLIPDYRLSISQLALQIAGMTPFHAYIHVLRSLHSVLQCDEVRQFIKCRHGDDALAKHESPVGANECSCYQLREQQARELGQVGLDPEHLFTICCLTTLQTDKDGCLTADFQREYAMNFEASSSAAKGTTSCDEQTTNVEARAVIKDGQDAALMCDEAREGDVIAGDFGMHEQNILVLRHRADEFYNLIGRGILRRGYKLPWAHHHNKYQGLISVRMSAEETIAFWAMELLDQQGLGNEVERLRFAMTAQPHGAVRIQCWRPG